MLKPLSLFLLALFVSPLAHANYTCIARCVYTDNDDEQISSNSFATEEAAREDLVNYCPRNFIEDVRCFTKGNPSADAPVVSGFLREAASASWCVTCYVGTEPMTVMGDSQADARQSCRDQGGVPVFASEKRCSF